MKNNIILFCALFSAAAAHSMETNIVTRIGDQEDEDNEFVFYEYGSKITSCLRGLVKKLEDTKSKAADTTQEIEKISVVKSLLPAHNGQAKILIIPRARL